MLGRTVALTRCPARLEEVGDVEVSGLWEVIEFEGEDRSVGIFGESFVLAHPTERDADGEPLYVTVEPTALIEQIDPQAHMAEIATERMISDEGERQTEAEIDGVRDPEHGHPISGILRVHTDAVPGVPVPECPSIRPGDTRKLLGGGS